MTAAAPLSLPPGGRRWRRVASLVLVTAAGAVAALIPWWGRDLDYFRVTEVEVRGTRWIRPGDVLARLGVDTLTSVWTDLDTIAARARSHPQVRNAVVRRRLPGRLVVEVTEAEPVAFVNGPSGLRAFDGSGRAFPFDPTRAAPDLPVLSRADTAAFALLAELKARLPSTYARVSEVRVVNPDQFRLVLVDVAVLAMRDVSAARFVELSSVEADLARRHVKPAELDLRFKDQVIARVP